MDKNLECMLMIRHIFKVSMCSVFRERFQAFNLKLNYKILLSMLSKAVASHLKRKIILMRKNGLNFYYAYSALMVYKYSQV